MAETLCPKCNAKMVIKTARRGFNAGGQFYSCTQYPRCRGTISIQSEENQTPNSGQQQQAISSSTQSFPRILLACSKLKDYQVRFFESVGVSKEILNIINDEEVGEEYRRAFSQWRVDYPDVSTYPAWDDTERQIISVAEKILTRGNITLCSHLLLSLIHI